MIGVVAEELSQALLGPSLDSSKELPARLAVARDESRLSECSEGLGRQKEDSLLSCTVSAEKDEPRRRIQFLESFGGSECIVVGNLDILLALNIRLTDTKRPDDTPSIFDAISR